VIVPKVQFEVEDMDPRSVYKLMTALVVPRPIGWIGTYSAEGTPNLAPYSFFNIVAASPVTVIFCPLRRSGGDRKDSLENARASGAFTINLVSDDLTRAMNVTSGEYAADADEFGLAELTAVPGTAVDAPYVAEARANAECRVTEIKEVGRPPMPGSIVFGEVVRIHVRADLMDGTRVDQSGLDAVGRMGGRAYIRNGSLFEMDRPQL
jgi:flavin reductase (DIM6/NTAB) family NADH-FMN oxidoreductase RutF